MEESGEVNLYGFVGNDGITQIDIVGLIAHDINGMIDAAHLGGMAAHKEAESELLTLIQSDKPTVMEPYLNNGKPYRPMKTREYGGRVCEKCTQNENGKPVFSYYLTRKMGPWPISPDGAAMYLGQSAPECGSDIQVAWWHTHPSHLSEEKIGRTKESTKYRYYWSGGGSFSELDTKHLTNKMTNPSALPLFVTYRSGISSGPWKYLTDMNPSGSTVRHSDEKPQWIDLKDGKRMPGY